MNILGKHTIASIVPICRMRDGVYNCIQIEYPLTVCIEATAYKKY